MVLNHTQRNTLAVTLDPYFETLREITDPNEAKSILGALLDKDQYNDENIQYLIHKNKVAEEAKLLHLIFLHPCPQNRTTTNIHYDEEENPDWVVFKVTDPRTGTYKIMREPVGLLSLTAYNDDTAEPVTKRDVDLYLKERIESEITMQQMRLGKSSSPAADNTDIVALPSRKDDDDILQRSFKQFSGIQQSEEEQNIILQLLLLILAFLGVLWVGEKTAKLAKH
jgi:hypothetical protein